MKRINFFSTTTLLTTLLLTTSCTTPTAKTDTPQPDLTSTKIEVPKVEVPTPATLPTLRIKAGLDEPLTDSKGNIWAAESGFEGGQSVDRPDLTVTGTDTPEIYHSEHYGMTSFSTKLPPGNYSLKLHFSEDYDGLTDSASRIFTYTIKDGDPASTKTIKEVKDFSPWKAAGAQFKAYVDTIPLTITTGELSITFTPQVENPQINAIEISPR